MEDFDQIYRAYAVPVKKYVLTLCRNEDAADDVTAEAFCKALSHLDDFDPDTRMLTWLCAIARNTYFDLVKRKESQNLPLLEDGEALPASDGDPEQALLQKQERLALYRGVQRLPEPCRDVVYLHSFAGLSFREIGDVLGRSETWARVTFYRSKNQLKGWIQNDEA